jgi:hypothetical protein
VGQRQGKGARTLVVYGRLADAVRHESNQAVAYWWGVTPQTVTKWQNGDRPCPSGGSRPDCQGTGPVVAMIRTRHATFASLIGLSLLRQMEYSGDADWF